MSRKVRVCCALGSNSYDNYILHFSGVVHFLWAVSIVLVNAMNKKKVSFAHSIHIHPDVIMFVDSVHDIN